MREQQWKGNGWVVRFQQRSERVVSIHVHGHLDAMTAESVTRALTETSADGAPLTVFLDTWEVTGYEPAFRRVVTDFRKRSRLNLRFVALVRSKLVAMGMSVASMATRQETTFFSDRSKFEGALRDATTRT